VVVDRDMQSQKSWMLFLAAQPAIATQRDLAESGHAFDIQMQQVARPGMLIALHRRRRVQIAPAAQLCSTQDATDRGRA